MASKQRSTSVDLKLTISHDTKAVPYPPAKRSHGQHDNHGFILVKGCPLAVDRIPEAQDNQALKDAIATLNLSHSSFFTIGCEKAFSRDNGGCFAKGYLEVAFNCRQLVQDPGNYFALFRLFDHWLFQQAWDYSLEFHWELMNVTFVEPNIAGWTLTIWVTTLGIAPNIESARRLWEFAIRQQAEFLIHSDPVVTEPIY